MVKFFTAALLGVAIATPALAQEEAPFTGPYVAGILGYDRLTTPNDGSDDGADGVLYGVNAGYDFQLGGAIVGIEGEFSDSSSKIRSNDVAFVGDNVQLNTDRDLYIGARIGAAVTPSTMIYAKGGYTNAKIETDYTNTGTSQRFNSTLDGYRVGAGVETKFNLFGPSGFAKVEYRYSNYKNLDFGGTDLDVDTDRHQVAVGLGIRF